VGWIKPKGRFPYLAWGRYGDRYQWGTYVGGCKVSFLSGTLLVLRLIVIPSSTDLTMNPVVWGYIFFTELRSPWGSAPSMWWVTEILNRIYWFFIKVLGLNEDLSSILQLANLIVKHRRLLLGKYPQCNASSQEELNRGSSFRAIEKRIFEDLGK